MGRNTVWGNRAPGDMVVQSEEDPAMAVIADFYSQDAMQIPEDTPRLDRHHLHEFAGQRVRVSCAFRSVDPTNTYHGERFVHLWSEEAQLGVVELHFKFVVYHLGKWPEDWPKHDLRLGTP